MKTNLDWNKFKLFYYIAKTGSFKATAENLNMSQPSLSRGIHDLEYQLGSKLFERKSRGIILTTQGKYLLEAVEKSFKEYLRAETLIKEEEGGLRGVIRVNLSPYLPPGWFVTHMKEFVIEYPELQLYIFSDEGIKDLMVGQSDISLGFQFDNQIEVKHEIIHMFKLNIYASQTYLKKYGIPKRSKDLYCHKLITSCFDKPLSIPQINWLLKLNVERGVKRTPYMCINLISEMLQAAEEGYGIISLPKEYIEKTNCPLIEILPTLKKPTIPLYVTYPKYLKDTQKIKVLVNYLKNKLTLQSNFSGLKETTNNQKVYSN